MTTEQTIQYIASECAVAAIKQYKLGYIKNINAIFPSIDDYISVEKIIGRKLNQNEQTEFNEHFIYTKMNAIACGIDAVIVFVEKFGGHKINLFARTYIGKAPDLSFFEDLEVEESETICLGGHWFLYDDSYKIGLTN